MNDFLKTMGQFGMEGLGYEPAEMTLEEEMNAEIAMEAELDEAYAQMDFANIVAGTSQAEAILTAMAEREVGLESNAGRDAATIYGEFGLEGFGMEAVKDVVARKAYSGIASLKALINTCISWLKQLIGITVASKKVFSGLSKKAKAMKKQLGKVQSKVSEKLKRDMPNYSTVLTKLAGTGVATAGTQGLYKTISSNSQTNNDSFVESLKTAEAADVEKMTKTVKDKNERFTQLNEDLKDIYDKGDTDDYEGSACFGHINTFLVNLEKVSNFYKSTDMAKGYEKQIKAFEKFRKEVDKKDSTVKAPTEVGQFLNAKITSLNKNSTYGKKILKEIVRLADDGLTMAKGIYASLV